MIPPALMPLSYPRTMAEIRLALENRITNATNRLTYAPLCHRGTPDPQALPNERLGVWLDWEGVEMDSDEPNQSTLLVSRWRIYIVGQDEGNDLFGGDAPLTEQAWGDILATITGTNEDISLDGAVDFVPTPTASHIWGTISGGDRRINLIEMALEVHHQLELVRNCPP